MKPVKPGFYFFKLVICSLEIPGNQVKQKFGEYTTGIKATYPEPGTGESIYFFSTNINKTMSLFNLFTKKQPAPAAGPALSLQQFRFYYLYGFTNDPNKTAPNAAAFNHLYQLVIGKTGGAAIAHSYHPYYIVNKKGTSVWIAAYAYLFVQKAQKEIADKMATEAGIYVVDTSGMFTAPNIWPDTRLMKESHPEFSTYAPFIIPFLVLDTPQPLRWDVEIQAGINTSGNAGEYVTAVTEAIRFFMPSPAFVVGFDEFDEKQPTLLIDKFVSYLSVLKR